VGLVAVVRRPGSSLDEAAVRGYLKARLASYKVPKHVRFREHLPTSGAGKVLARALREAFERERGGPA
jgi:acyl-CoA synthetase (AMP-forming)/AMP-acid ligase II